MAELENEKDPQPSFNEEVNNDSNLGESNQNESKSDNEESLETDITAELESLKEKCETLHNDYLRLYADFDNYKKRTLKDKADLIKSAGENIFNNMLPLIDDFERAMNAIQASDDINALREGVELIYNKVGAYLEKYGVKSIDTADQVFDVDLHEAIAMIPAPSEEQKGKVLDCVKKGYTRNDKVLRHAQVAVGQ